MFGQASNTNIKDRNWLAPLSRSYTLIDTLISSVSASVTLPPLSLEPQKQKDATYFCWVLAHRYPVLNALFLIWMDEGPSVLQNTIVRLSGPLRSRETEVTLNNSHRCASGVFHRIKRNRSSKPKWKLGANSDFPKYFMITRLICLWRLPCLLVFFIFVT